MKSAENFIYYCQIDDNSFSIVEFKNKVLTG